MSLHSEEYKGFTIEIEQDCDISIDDVICNEPVAVYVFDRHRSRCLIDQSKRNMPAPVIIRAIGQDDDLAIVAELSRDSEWRNDRFMVEYDDWTVPRCFKTEHNAACALFFAEYGAPLSDFRAEQIDTRDSWYFVAFWQSELDEYAGCKNAKSMRDDIRAWLDGEVYGFTVYDSESEYVDSCYGFIGEMEHAIQAAKESIQ